MEGRDEEIDNSIARPAWLSDLHMYDTSFCENTGGCWDPQPTCPPPPGEFSTISRSFWQVSNAVVNKKDS